MKSSQIQINFKNEHLFFSFKRRDTKQVVCIVYNIKLDYVACSFICFGGYILKQNIANLGIVYE